MSGTVFLKVDKNNFEDVLQRLPDLIEKSLFVSLDCEFTGIDLSKDHQFNFFDDLELRYEKLKISAKKFEVLQYGLTFFLKETPKKERNDDRMEDEGEEEEEGEDDDNDEKVVVAKIFSFDIFKDFRDSQSHVFQNSSMKFLSSFDCDFNSIVKNGITYMNEEEERATREVLAKYNSSSPIPEENYSLEDKMFVREKGEEISKWFNEGIEEAFILECNGYQRKLLYDNFSDNDFLDGCINISTEKTDSQKKFIRIVRRDGSRSDSIERDIKAQRGFSRVIDLLRGYDKPIVCHNGMLDLAHTFQKFVRALPDDVVSFKKQLSDVFPLLVDTKVLSSSLFACRKEFGRKNSLGDLHNKVKELKVVEPLDMENNQLNSHNAGYDSYMTGVVYAGERVIAANAKNDESFSQFSNVGSIIESVNMIYMMRFHAGFALDHSNQVKPKDRSDVFYISNMSPNLGRNEILKPFHKFGNPSITFSSDNSGFVVLKRHENQLHLNLKEARIALCDRKVLRPFSITTYDDAKKSGILKSRLYMMKGSNERKRKLEDPLMPPSKKDTCTIL